MQLGEFAAGQRRRAGPCCVAGAIQGAGSRAQTFGDEALAAAILDRLLHDAEVLAINGPSFRLKGRLDALRTRPDDHTDPA